MLLGRAEVDEALETVDFFDYDVEATVEREDFFGAPTGERVSIFVELIIVLCEGIGGDESERAGLRQLDEETVAPDIGNDGGERAAGFQVELALEEFEDLDFHAFAFGKRGILLSKTEVFAKALHRSGVISGITTGLGGVALVFDEIALHDAMDDEV